MRRECTRCRRTFLPADLRREESKNMLAQRRAAGLEGVRFLYYHCGGCGMDDIFVDIVPLEAEAAADFEARRDTMESVVRDFRADDIDAVVVPVQRS